MYGNVPSVRYHTLMAGDWIKLEHATPDKPEVYAIAAELGIPQEHVLGCLLRVWLWVDQQSLNGNGLNVSKVTLGNVARHAGFGEAMQKVGWLIEKDGLLSFPNFDRHNGQTAKNRVLTAQRVANYKKRQGNVVVTHDELPREEKKREDIKDLSTSLRSVDSVIAVLPEKQKTTTLATITSPPLPKKPNTELNRLIWDAYSAEYLKAYGTEPIRNAQSNGVIAKIGKRLPAAAAPQVAAFYLSVKQPFYVRTRHSLPNLLRDCEALHTQWITGRKATTLEARSAEHVDNVTEQIKRVGARLENRHETA